MYEYIFLVCFLNVFFFNNIRNIHTRKLIDYINRCVYLSDVI